MRYISEECIDRAIIGDTAAILEILNHYSDIIQNKSSRTVMNKDTLKTTRYHDRNYEERLKIKLILAISHFGFS